MFCKFKTYLKNRREQRLRKWCVRQSIKQNREFDYYFSPLELYDYIKTGRWRSDS